MCKGSLLAIGLAGILGIAVAVWFIDCLTYQPPQFDLACGMSYPEPPAVRIFRWLGWW
jgi:hypothetical protein